MIWSDRAIPVDPANFSANGQRLVMTYHYTTETSYFDVRLTNLKLTATQLDGQKVQARCAQWVQQAPCWTEQDLVTREAALAVADIASLKSLLKDTKVLQLADYYGPAPGARCYTQALSIELAGTIKKITYCSRPEEEPAPAAFRAVVARLQELAGQKLRR